MKGNFYYNAQQEGKQVNKLIFEIQKTLLERNVDRFVILEVVEKTIAAIKAEEDKYDVDKRSGDRCGKVPTISF